MYGINSLCPLSESSITSFTLSDIPNPRPTAMIRANTGTKANTVLNDREVDLAISSLFTKPLIDKIILRSRLNVNALVFERFLSPISHISCVRNRIIPLKRDTAVSIIFVFFFSLPILAVFL